MWLPSFVEQAPRQREEVATYSASMRRAGEIPRACFVLEEPMFRDGPGFASPLRRATILRGFGDEFALWKRGLA
jgi:hypothetical protein